MTLPNSNSRATRIAAVIVLAAVAVSCSDSTGVPDLNNVTTGILATGLNRASVSYLALGQLDQDRIANGFRHIVFGGTMGRDVYNLDPAESRFITELLGASPDAGGFTGGGDYTPWFSAIRTGNILRNGLATAADLTASEKSAVRGLDLTMQAIDLYHALEMRDSLGVPVDLNRDAIGTPAPIRCKANDLAFIAAQLDSGYADLKSAGTTAFPFPVPPGLTTHGNFATPATFASFNRAWKGKIEVYRALDHQRPDAGGYTRALAAFDGSFLSLAPADTGLGPYYFYSTAASEAQNPVGAANTIHLNPSVGDSLLPGDARRYKVLGAAGPYARNGVATTYDPLVAGGSAQFLTLPLAMLKNEEVVLLRAQAEIGLGDLVSATRDINYVHVNGGGLAPYPVFATSQAAISAVLYEKRYSLLLEGAQRLVDLRAYNRFNATYLKKEIKADVFTAALPIPVGEVNARSGNVTPVCQ